MLAGRSYTLLPTPTQEAMLAEFGNLCRVVWNTALDQRRQAVHRWTRGETHPFAGYSLQCRELAEAKAELPFLTAAPSHILQQTLRDLDRACSTHGTFRVRWRGKHRWQPAFRFPAGGQIEVQRLGRKRAAVKLPKVGWLHFRWSRPMGGTIKNATISFDGRRWRISFCVDDHTEPATPDGPDVGVDLGVATAVATSDGELHDRLFLTPGEQERLTRLQRRLARAQRGGINRRKLVARIRAIWRRVANRRQDFTNKLADQLTRRYGFIVIEDLDVRAMSSSASGTVEAPGRGVKAKAGLNRSILAKGWGQLASTLDWKARVNGAQIVRVNPAFSSQQCHPCGHVDPASRESQASFRCTSCGHTAHADVNAARNLETRGRAVVPACGDLQASDGSVKQEPGGNPRGSTPSAPAGIPVLEGREEVKEPRAVMSHGLLMRQEQPALSRAGA